MAGKYRSLREEQEERHHQRGPTVGGAIWPGQLYHHPMTFTNVAQAIKEAIVKFVDEIKEVEEEVECEERPVPRKDRGK